MSKTVEKQTAISLESFYAKRFLISSNLGSISPKDLKFSVKQGLVSNKEDKKRFNIIFEVAFENTEEEFELDCFIEFTFRTNKNITKKFLESGFVTQGAPAIAFPYVRSMITSLTINAGFTPIIIPTYNFTK